MDELARQMAVVVWTDVTSISSETVGICGVDSIVARSVGKRFGRRYVFRGVDVRAEPGEVIAITGHNGSGKSTLLRILSGLLTPTEGEVYGLSEGRKLSSENIAHAVGYVAPYVNSYDSFTARENLEFVRRVRRIDSVQNVDDVLSRVGLAKFADQTVGTYSSGMKQRLRIGLALLHDPAILMFDEPGTNLDAAGRDLVASVVMQQKASGRVVILATNSEHEAAMCDREISMTEFVLS